MRLNTLILCLFIIFQYISSNDIYIDKNSGENREACGDSETPCRTLTYALDIAQPNDVLIFKSPFDAEGRSYSNFVLSKNITIRSEDLIPENNIVSCAYGDYFIHSDPTVGGQLSLKIEGITVQGCGKLTDTNGTVIHSANNLDIHINNCVIRNNKGNAIAQLRRREKLSNLTIQKTRFIKNENSLQLDSVNATISDSHFLNNTGSNTLRHSYLKASSLVFDSNSGAEFGTGMYFYSTNAHLNQCSFKNNSAKRKGTLAAFLSKVEIDHSRFESNQAISNAGAIFLNERSTCTIRNSIIFNNTGGFFGGAIGLESSKLSIINSKVESNRASKGGAISLGVNGETYIYDSEFVRNNASHGAVVHLNHAKYLELKNSTFSYNHAKINGSVVYCRNSVIDIKSNRFDENTVNDRKPSKRTDIHCSEEVPEDFCEVLGDSEYYKMCYKTYSDDQRKKYIIISVFAITFIGIIVILIVIASICTRNDKIVKDGYQKYEENDEDSKEELIEVDENEGKKSDD